MDNLPTELLGLIADHCAPSGLESLRLANRRSCEVATPLLFEHFHLGIFQESLNRFEAISKSRLAKYVKRCAVCLDRLPDWDRNQWERAIYHRGVGYWEALGDDPSPDRNRYTWTRWSPASAPQTRLYDYFSQKRLDDAFSRFDSVRRQQIHLPNSGFELALKECFVMFPNLATVACTLSITSRVELPMPSAFWDCMQSKILVAPRDFVFGGILSSPSREDREFAHRVSFLIFEAMAFRASFSGTKPVTQLALQVRQHTANERREYETWESLMVGQASLLSPPPDHSLTAKLNKVLDGFQHLTHIDWCICQTFRPGVNPASLAKDTARFLLGCRNLQSLCLSLYDPHHAPPGRGDITIGDATIKKLLDDQPLWPNLHHLQLRFQATSTGLLALFRAVSPSLLSLELTDMEVGNAHELITQIPEILILEKVQLKSIWHVPEMSRIQRLFINGLDGNDHLQTGVKNFLLRNVEKCPDLGLG